MLFCEDCRLKKNWPRAASYPYAGAKENSKCEVCGKSKDCHDVPGSKLTPVSERNFSERILDQVMEQGYEDRANNLIVTYVDGKTDYKKTEILKKMFVRINGKIDWLETYRLRKTAQEQIQKSEQMKRDIKTGGYNGT
jgi:hypothetical protein